MIQDAQRLEPITTVRVREGCSLHRPEVRGQEITRERGGVSGVRMQAGLLELLQEHLGSCEVDLAPHILDVDSTLDPVPVMFPVG